MHSSSKEEWSNPIHSTKYLERANSIPHRAEGEDVMVDLIPENASRILDLGSGDGRLMISIKNRVNRNNSKIKIDFVAVDVSPTMINHLHSHFGIDKTVKIVEHDLDVPLPLSKLGYFDVIVSSFAIHHLKHSRKFTLYEVFDMLNSGGIFCNLEHVSSVSVGQHLKFLKAIGIEPGQGDKTNRLLSVEKQLQMMKDLGFVEVDCYWKWYEMALMVGFKI